jgi:hypothetical protein
MTGRRSRAESVASALNRLREIPRIDGLGNFHSTPVGGRRLFGPIWWFQGDLWWATPDLLVRLILTPWHYLHTADKDASAGN